jgi:hypothetical protein
MPRNSETGKANRRPLTAEDVYNYRLQQHKARKGKKPVSEDEEVPQPEASGSAQSPSTTLQPLVSLTLDSSNDDSPAAPPPSGTVSFAVEIPVRRQAPRPVPRSAGRITIPRPRRQPSPTALSQSSDDGRNVAARVAALEARFEEFRKEIDRRLTAAGI